MATALQLPPPDTGPTFNEASTGFASPHRHMNEYASRLSIAEFDHLKDTRYPSLSPTSTLISPIISVNKPEQPADVPSGVDGQGSWNDEPAAGAPEVWGGEKLFKEAATGRQPRQDASTSSKPQPQSPNVESALLPNSVPSGDPVRVADRVLREDAPQRRPSRGRSVEATRFANETGQEMGQRTSGLRQSQTHDQYGLVPSSAPRHSPVPAAATGACPSASPAPLIVPLAAAPSFTPSAIQVHISPKPRASAQYPTYITPPPVMNNMNVAYTPAQVPKEEVCVECAMRDQDMADVDVTSPGVWERESDAHYEELLHRELEEEASGILQSENSSRPRARGMPLSEQNLRIWLSINPKEPSSRQQTLDQYVRSQRTLLEAEALAHARAMREAKQMEEKMRNTYSQLRRSAYELGNAVQRNEEASAGVRIKPPRSSSVPTAAALAKTDSHGREVTLLENGMIVEHVDVRKEEKEERDKQRREARRDRSSARKSSRGSAIDVASIYSMPVPGSQRLQTNDSGFFSGVRGGENRYSQSFSPRPSSMLTTGDQPHMLPRAYSQASFSDMQSIGSSSSPRRSRFFGFKNLTAGWRSQESFAPSGSMMDMHVALQREEQYLQHHPLVDPGSITPTLRVPEHRVQEESSSRTETPASVLDPKRKKNGFKKIWKIVTGKSGPSQKGRIQARSMEKSEDYAPLAPPPPLSYLVDRDRGPGSRRHVSTPSLHIAASPNPVSPYPASLVTSPSNMIPSPTSSRHPIPDKDNVSDGRKNSGNLDDQEQRAPSGDTTTSPVDVDMRGRPMQSSSRTLSSLGPQTPVTAHSRISIAIRRDKSLPPLPSEAVEFPHGNSLPDGRPQTMFTYDHLPMSFPGDDLRKLQPPQAPFSAADKRRQSFGGLSSKPMMQSLPMQGISGSTLVPPFLAEERYGEFGASRLSLKDADSSRGTGTQRSRDSTARPKRPRSRFGLSALFGKKSSQGGQSGENSQDDIMSGFRTSASDPEHLPATNGNGYAHTGSTSAHSGPGVQRMSVASRKNIAELVDQDPDFLAYRYPSTDQRFEVR